MIFTVFIYTFVFVFLLNIIPIFGPPTWMILSYITLNYSIPSFPLFILIAVCASTLGRFVLILLSKHIIKNRFLGENYRKNMENLQKYLEKKKKVVSVIFLIEAFTPLPSDQFFIAYGLTGLKARYALIPFFIGRIFTYSFWVYSAEISKIVITNSVSHISFLSGSFIFLEFLVLVFVYFFVKIDWKYFITNHKFRIFH